MSRRTILLSAVVLVFLILAGFGLARRAGDTNQSGAAGTGSLDPATAAEKQEAADRKDQVVEEQRNQTATPSLGIKNVGVVITSATSTDVRGYTSGVFEDGGICTATATKGSQTITKTSTGFKNVSYTSCSPIYWGSTLGNGNWTINLSYKSAAAQGSTSQTIEVK